MIRILYIFSIFYYILLVNRPTVRTLPTHTEEEKLGCYHILLEFIMDKPTLLYKTSIPETGVDVFVSPPFFFLAPAQISACGSILARTNFNRSQRLAGKLNLQGPGALPFWRLTDRTIKCTSVSRIHLAFNLFFRYI